MAKMVSLDMVARKRVKSWRESADMTRVKFGVHIGRNGVWVSRWEAGHFNADLTTLARMAEAFDHTLYELFDLSANAREQEVMECYRRIRPERRGLARDLLCELAGWRRDLRKSRR